VDIPHQAGEIIAALHEHTRILSQSHEEEVTRFTLQADRDIWAYLTKKFHLKGE
jgi:hypothetical protein